MRFAVERIYCVVALLYFSNAVVPILTGTTPGTEGATSSNPFLLVLQTAVYGALSFFLWPHLDRFLQRVVLQFWILILPAIAIISAAWSVDPVTSIEKGIVVGATTSFGFYFGTRYPVRQQVRLIAIAMGIAGLLSILCVLLTPQYGIMHDDYAGAWKGVFIHKNMFGKAMALGAISCAWLSMSRSVHRLLASVMFVVFAWLVWMSQSRASLVTMLSVVLLAQLLPALRWRSTTLLPLTVILLLGATMLTVLAINDSDTVLTFLGRDATLSGRTLLWSNVILSIRDHPLLGYGYRAFWKGMRGPSGSIIASIGWDAPHAHSGFLDLCLDLGLLGVVMFFMGYFVALRRAVKWIRVSRRSETLWPFMFLIFFFLLNLTETSILETNGLFWALYAAASTSVATTSIIVHHVGRPASSNECTQEPATTVGLSLG